QRILDRDPTLMSDDEKADLELDVPAPEPSPVSNLPRSLTMFVGRARELTALQSLMVDPDVRMITLTGTGGVGKTRLLLELARPQGQQSGAGGGFVRLGLLTAPAVVGAEIATAIAQRDGTDGPTADDLASHLRERELLLAIDNFEHM